MLFDVFLEIPVHISNPRDLSLTKEGLLRSMIGCFYLRDLTLILLLLESCFDSLLTVFADVHSDFPVGVGSADRNVRKDKTKLHWFASHEDHEKGQSEYLRLRSKQQILTKNPYSQSRPPVLKSEQWSLILDRLILYLLRIHSR